MTDHQGSDVFEHLDSIIPDTLENQILEKQELFRIDLTQKMRDLRKKAGLTQKDVAEKLGVSQGWVSKSESADRDLTISAVIAYFFALGATVKIEASIEDSLEPKQPTSESQATEKEKFLDDGFFVAFYQKTEVLGGKSAFFTMKNAENYISEKKQQGLETYGILDTQNAKFYACQWVPAYSIVGEFASKYGITSTEIVHLKGKDW